MSLTNNFLAHIFSMLKTAATIPPNLSSRGKYMIFFIICSRHRQPAISKYRIFKPKLTIRGRADGPNLIEKSFAF